MDAYLLRGDLSCLDGAQARYRDVWTAVNKPKPTIKLELPTCKVHPPTASRGVECTDNGGGTIDWLAFTLHGDLLAVMGAAKALLGELEYRRNLQGDPVGWQGYQESAVVLGSGRIGWHPGQPHMGLHCDLPASALGELRRRGDRDCLGLIAWVLLMGGKVTRLDVAFDDRLGALPLDRISRHLEAGAFSTGIHRKNIKHIRDLAGGQTWYLGAPTSDKKVRIYDKKAERAAKGIEVKGIWNRLEFQFRAKPAHKLAEMLINSEVGALGAVVRGLFDFKVLKGEDSNMRRREPAVWWLAFLKYAERLAVSLPQATRTLDTVADWFRNQIAPSFALLYEAFGGDFLGEVATQGKERWRAHHRALLQCSEGGGCIEC